MELTVTLKIQVDDDKVFNALPKDMQEEIAKEVELDKKWAGADNKRHKDLALAMRSTYITQHAQEYFGSWVGVHKSAPKGLGIDLNEGEIQNQKFREDK